MKGLRSWFLGEQMWTFDLLIALIATAIAWLTIRKVAARPFSDLITKDGTAIYGAILSAAAALLGFAIAAVTIVTGLITARAFRDLRNSRHYKSFWFSFTWTIRVLGLASAFAFVAIFIGHFSAIWPGVAAAVVWSVLAAAISLGRSGRTLEVLLDKVREAQKTDPPNVTVVTQYPKTNS